MAQFCNALPLGRRVGRMLGLLAALLLTVAPVAVAQQTTVSGTVLDQQGQPVIGATVIEQGDHQRRLNGR